MALLVLLVLVSSAFIGVSDATWCVCRSDASPAALQKTIDYACGAGADCSPILQNGVCYSPNTVQAHCSYAANSYFQRRGQAGGTCDFASTATIANTDPSYAGCSFPSTASAAGTGPTGNTPTTFGTATPGTPSLTPTNNNGVLGLGPATPTTVTTDGSGAAVRGQNAGTLSLPIAITMLSSLVALRRFWW